MQPLKPHASLREMTMTECTRDICETWRHSNTHSLTPDKNKQHWPASPHPDNSRSVRRLYSNDGQRAAIESGRLQLLQQTAIERLVCVCECGVSERGRPRVDAKTLISAGCMQLAARGRRRRRISIKKARLECRWTLNLSLSNKKQEKSKM